MGDSFELKTMDKTPCENQVRVERSKVMVSLRTMILTAVVFMLIFCTLITTSFYIIHSTTKIPDGLKTVQINHEQSKAKLRQLEDEFANMKLSHLITNLQLEYVEQMNQNVSHTLFLDMKSFLELHNATKKHILQIYDGTENPFVETEAKAFDTYRNKLSNKIDKTFATLSHEHTFKRLASEDWNLLNKTKDQIRTIYDENFQLALSQYEGRVPPEISFEFHKNVTEFAISEGVARKIVPPSSKVYSELRVFLNAIYYKKITDNSVIGINFGESRIRWYYYYNGELRGGKGFESYVGVEEWSGYEDYRLKLQVGFGSEESSIFYDLKEIVRTWSSFNKSSHDLYWTFKVQEANDSGSLFVLSKSGSQHSVKAVVSKLFRKVFKNTRDAGQLSPVSCCVIAIPSDFDARQRELILDASKMAGFQKVIFLDEDIAAALTLQHVRGPWNITKTIVFIQFNQLSWNLYVLEGCRSSYSRIVSNSYNNSEDLVNCCITEYCQSEQCDEDKLKYDGSMNAKLRWRRLYENCEDAIYDFTSNPPKFHSSVYGISSYVKIYRNSTEKAIKEKLEPFTRFIDANLRQASLTKENIDEIIMGGKYGLLWAVQEVISEYFNGRSVAMKGISPSHTIAYGAAVKGLEVTAEAIKRSRGNGGFM